MADFDRMSAVYSMDVFLVRHAQSYNNCLYDVLRAEMGDVCNDAIMKEQALRHESDCGLSEGGYEQIDRLEAFLSRGGWSHAIKDSKPESWVVQSSPMKRCLLTATAIQRGLGWPVFVNPNLYETGGCYHKNVC